MKKLLPILSLLLIASCGPVANQNVVSQQNIDNGDDPVLATKDEIIKSQMNRGKGTTVVSQADIRIKTKELKKAYLPDGHSEIPTSMTLESNVVSINYSQYDRNCGITSNSETKLGDRISDCNKIYNLGLDVKASWSSQLYGVAGEGNWSLVSVSINEDIKNIVWYDLTTKLLWSHNLGQRNFEEAATTLGRACAVFQESNEYSLDSNFVTWRLPTRADFLQADINGSRYVLNNTDKEYWTATQNTVNTAWTINQSTGNSTSVELTDTRAVRCVGIPVQ
jgi:hypothetical protein